MDKPAWKILAIVFCVLFIVSAVSAIGYRNASREVLNGNYHPIPREFYAIIELKIWLFLDTTDDNIYIENTYDCEDFAMDLVDNAREDGYLIYSMGARYLTTEGMRNHAFCVTRINGIWCKIEPQSDAVGYLGVEF